MGGGEFWPPWFFALSRKISPATYDETSCKFLLYTYEDSRNSIWSKKLSRGHVEDINVAWVENHKNKDCIFRVLRGILEGLFMKPVFLDLSNFMVLKRHFLGGIHKIKAA